MRPPWLDKLEKVGFVLGLAVLAYLGGYATRAFELPPNALLERAWLQGRAAARATPPDFLHKRAYDRHGVRIPSPDEVQPGLRLVTSVWAEDGVWNPEVRLIDVDGTVRHRWRIDPEAVFPDSANRRGGLGLDELDFQGSHLLDDGDVLVNVEYVGTVRLDACGEVRWKLAAGSHHSIEPAGDGTFWIPGVTPEARVASPGHPRGFPGLGAPAFQDQLLRVDDDGRVLEVINLLDVLFANGLQDHLVKSNYAFGTDVTHLNDIEPLPPSLAEEHPLFDVGDVALSLKNLDLVLVLDPASGRVKWHLSEPYVRQHDPDFLPDGWIGVFDNKSDATDRGTMLGGSRIVAVQPHTGAIRVLYPTDRSDAFYTSVRGKWQRLPNGNLLLAESGAGRLVEAAPDGRTVWEWLVEPYDERFTPYVSQGQWVDVTPEEVAAWACSPETDDERAEAES